MKGGVSMKNGDLYLWVTIRENTDPRGLWEKIKPYGVNLTELGGGTAYAYGEVVMETAVKIIACCEQHGKVEVSLSAIHH